jgi:hypothetical protein
MENNDSEKPSNTLTEELSRTVLELEEIGRTLYRYRLPLIAHDVIMFKVKNYFLC